MEKLILDILEESEKKFAETTAVKWLKKKEIYEIDYRGLMENVRSVRKGLSAEGFQEKHIALIGSSSVEWVESYLGIITGNTVAVPLDAMLPLGDLADLINRSDSEALFLSPKNQGLLDGILAQCPNLKRIWLLQEEITEFSDGRVTCLGKLKDGQRCGGGFREASDRRYRNDHFYLGNYRKKQGCYADTGKSGVQCAFRGF